MAKRKVKSKKKIKKYCCPYCRGLGYTTYKSAYYMDEVYKARIDALEKLREK